MYAAVWQFCSHKVGNLTRLKTSCDPLSPSPLPELPPGDFIASALPGDDGDQREDPAGSLEDDLGDTGEVSDSWPSRYVVLFLLLFLLVSGQH